MSILAQAALIGALLGAPGTAPAPSAPAASGTVTRTQQSPGTDPVVQTMRAEVERLQEAARQAEAAAPDDVARLRARVDLALQLLLVVLHRQEELYLQNQALLAAASAARLPAIVGPVVPSAPGVVPPSTRPATIVTQPVTGRPVGPLFGKRGGDKVHRPRCSSGERIAPSERVLFATLGQAALAGYSACKLCHPER